MPHHRPHCWRNGEKSTKKAEAKGDQRGRTQKVHEWRVSQVTGLERSAIQTEMNLMGQKMCPRGELGLLPSRPQTSMKYLFSRATWRRQCLERGLKGCCDCGEHINFSNLSSNIKAPRFIFQPRPSTIMVSFQSCVPRAAFKVKRPAKNGSLKHCCKRTFEESEKGISLVHNI